MISYWVGAKQRASMDLYLATLGKPLAGFVEVREFEELAPVMEVTAGPHIFSALDQLTPTGRRVVADLYDQLGAVSPGLPRLNDPRRVLLRHDLLIAMARADINRFAVRRANEKLADLRFPVFVREESGHGGSLTGLLADRRSLSRALLAFRVRGLRAADLLVVEFCDLGDEQGHYHKAAAFRIGNTIVPAHRLRGTPWVLKWDEALWTEATMRANIDYVSANPHEAWLRRVFDLAGVDYGRCDYGVGINTLQVWEINLDPTIGFGPGPPKAPLSPPLAALLEQYRNIYHPALQAALLALDPKPSRDRITVRLDPKLVAQARTEAAQVARRDGLWRFLQRIYEQPTLGRPFRVAYLRLFPRK
jgi:hypothetical protein